MATGRCWMCRIFCVLPLSGLTVLSRLVHCHYKVAVDTVLVQCGKDAAKLDVQHNLPTADCHGETFQTDARRRQEDIAEKRADVDMERTHRNNVMRVITNKMLSDTKHALFHTPGGMDFYRGAADARI